jgi:aminopeptidase-like protein
MAMPDVADSTAPAQGVAMYELARELYPIARSITGPGVRDSLAIIARIAPITVREVRSGTPALDWIVPREWTIRDAYIKDPNGRRIVDFNASNLHVIGYSVPVNRRLSLDELRPHLHALADRPDWIPYRTSYYQETWGFCLTQRQLDALEPGEYEVMIDADLEDGSLTYGECYLPGEVADEILITTHICHPSMANDNLSGIVVAAFLAQALQQRERRHSYRILFIPGTIGSLVWLSRNEDRLGSIRHGLALAGVGDAGAPTYKPTRNETAAIDRAVQQVLAETGRPHSVVPYSPWGYDDRQFNSLGFQLPVGLLMRTQHGTYPEYHTSADDLSFITPQGLADSLDICEAVMLLLDRNRTYRNLSPKGEPQLGRRGLYDPVGGASGRPDQLAMLWLLNQSDGSMSLLDIARRSGLRFEQLWVAASALERAGLLEAVPVEPS